MSNIEVFEGERATHYDEFVEVWIPCYREFMALTSNLLLSQRTEVVKDVLIAGCGTGNEIEVLAKAASGWRLTGVDPSPEMVLQAQQKLAHYLNVNVIEGVVADLPDKPFDAATLLLVLHFLQDNLQGSKHEESDKLTLLKDIAARLKPQAPCIVFDICGEQRHIEQNLTVLAGLLPADIDKEVLDFRLNRMAHSLHHVDEQRFIDLCLEAGFQTPIRFFQATIYMGWLLKKA